MDKRGWVNSDSATGMVSLAVAIVGWYRLRNIPFQSLEAGLGPAFYPAIVLAVLTLLALIITAKGVFITLRSRTAESALVDDDGGERNGRAPARVSPAYKMIGLFTGYAVLFRYIGFLPASGLFLFLSLRLLGVGLRNSIVITVAATVGFYLVFGLMFRIRLF